MANMANRWIPALTLSAAALAAPLEARPGATALEAQFEKEIPSSAIGEGVMQRLRTIDQVAYVRFASVYKEFRDVAEFVDEISTLAKPKPARPE